MPQISEADLQYYQFIKQDYDAVRGLLRDVLSEVDHNPFTDLNPDLVDCIREYVG